MESICRGSKGVMEDLKETRFLRNRVRCRKCGTSLESKSDHDFQTCSCGAISIDGGLECPRRLGELADIEELSETVLATWDEDRECWL